MCYDNDTYLGEVKKITLYLMKFMLILLGKKSTRNGIYMCGQKDKICVGLVNHCEYLYHK